MIVILDFYNIDIDDLKYYLSICSGLHIRMAPSGYREITNANKLYSELLIHPTVSVLSLNIVLIGNRQLQTSYVNNRIRCLQKFESICNKKIKLELKNPLFENEDVDMNELKLYIEIFSNFDYLILDKSEDLYRQIS